MKYKALLNKATWLFVGVILFFTFFSRTINNINTPRVKTVNPKEGYLIRTIRGQGTIQPANSTRLYLPAELIIDRILVNPGDFVTEETALFQLNRERVRSAYEEEYIKYCKANLELEEAKEELLDKGSNAYNLGELEKKLKLAREDKESKESMFQSGFISKRALDEADIQLEQIQSQYREALDLEENNRQNEASRLRNVQRKISTIEMELAVLERKVTVLSELKKDSLFRSPFEGKILTIPGSEGIRISTEEPVVSLISKNDSYTFQASLNSDDLKGLSRGERASLFLDGNREVDGLLESWYANSDHQTSTVVFSLNDPDLQGHESGYFVLRKRMGFYSYILPKRSIRGAGQNQFIFRTELKRGALSDTVIARKIKVKVLESSESHSAVTGALDSDSSVILDEDRKSLDDSDRIIVE